MFHLLGLEANLETVIVLARPYVSDLRGPIDGDGLRQGYRRFLEDLQPQVPTSDLPGPCFVTEPETVRVLLELFGAESELSDVRYVLAEGDSRGATEALGRTRSALLELRELSPALESLFDLVVTTVFAAPSRSADGGTINTALGVVWVNPRPSWSTVDFLEFFVHELTHTLVFLSELRHGLYARPAELADPANFALSALRRTPRPLDKALHSAVVAAEILLAREATLGHPEYPVLHPATADLADGALASVESIAAVAADRDLLLPHALELLERCRTAIAEVAVCTS
jgi:hypothetical protein